MSGISRFGARNQAQASPQLVAVGSRGRSVGITKFGAAPESVQRASTSNAPQTAAQNIKTVSPVSPSSTTLGTRIDVKA